MILANFDDLECSKNPNCNRRDEELKSLLKRLPNGSIDLVLGGAISNNNTEINEVPIIGDSGKGQFLHIIQFSGIKENKYSDLNVLKKTIKTCHYFFESTMDCHLTNDKSGTKRASIITKHKKRKIPATFLDKDIIADREFTKKELKSKTN